MPTHNRHLLLIKKKTNQFVATNSRFCKNLEFIVAKDFSLLQSRKKVCMVRRLVLFDVDGTLCEPMGQIGPDMVATLSLLKKKGWDIGVVGGSDRAKCLFQLGKEVLDCCMDHAFHENGTVYYKHGQLVMQEKLEDFMTPEQVSDLVCFLLQEVSTSKSPFMTGTFLERRSCMLNCSPCGRACTPVQRHEFWEWDKKTHCRELIRQRVLDRFPDLPLEIAIGGQISMDIYPTGLNKTRCLLHVEKDYDEIHFIGDRTMKGGNDYDLYIDKRVIGHSTTGVECTIQIIHKIITCF